MWFGAFQIHCSIVASQSKSNVIKNNNNNNNNRLNEVEKIRALSSENDLKMLWKSKIPFTLRKLDKKNKMKNSTRKKINLNQEQEREFYNFSPFLG